LEPEIRQRVAFREALEHHLADPSGRDLGCSTLPDRGLELVDEAIDLFARQRLRCGLPDRARELPPVELLAAAVALQDLDAGGLAPLKGGESLLTPVADPPPPDGIAVLGFPRADDAGVGIAASGALHRHKIWDGRPQDLVAGRFRPPANASGWARASRTSTPWCRPAFARCNRRCAGRGHASFRRRSSRRGVGPPTRTWP